jgi:hypothetical protein
MNESGVLCEPRKESPRIAAEVSLSLVRSVKDGILIADLGKSEAKIVRHAAQLCRTPRANILP